MTFSTLQNQVNDELNKLNGQVALEARFIKTNDRIAFNDSLAFWAGSVIKIPIALAVFKQVQDKRFNLIDRMKIDQANCVDGSGIAKLFDKDTELTLHDLTVLMLTISDNSATNQLIDVIGWESIEAYMKILGLNKISLRHKMMIKEGRGPNLITAQDMSFLLEKMYRNELPGSKDILDIMKHEQDRSRIQKGVLKGIEVASKLGSLEKAHHSAGVVYVKNPFTFVFLSDDQEDKMMTNAVLVKCVELCSEYGMH
jgi:beta-lactamase class A